MKYSKTILAAKIAVGLGVIPVLIYAYASGPDPRHTAAPGDDPNACATSGCHVGTALNGGGGSVKLTSSTGTTYTPGQAQTLTITINDSKARVYGFQMSARLDSNPANGQAGDFPASQQQMIVICDNGSLKGKNGCPSSIPVQFIEHSSPFRSNTINVQWTAPATNVGTVTIYVAANAANGDGNNTGDHIYTTKLQLSPASSGGGGNTPTIVAIQSNGGFNAKAGIASGTWIEIYGNNFTSDTRVWSLSDFTNNGQTAPTSLDGISVTIGGVPAFVEFVQPTIPGVEPDHVNVLVPDGIPVGSSVPVVLSNSQGQSAAFPVQTSNLAPALLAPAAWNASGKQYVVAQFSDYTYVGNTGLVSGVTFRPAKPGDVITIYGIGFGPVREGTSSGTVAPPSSTLVNTPNFRFGQTAAKLLYSGLAPYAVGLYQFNIIVPNVSPGDQQLNVDVGGVTLNQPLFITVGQ